MRQGLIITFLLFATFIARGGISPAQHFTDKVKPLLDLRCVSCHGAEKAKAGLRLDSREATIKGGDSGPALVPHKPDESLLLQAVMHSKKDLEMPPKEKLTTNDVAILRQWILEGAPWPAEAVAAVALNPAKSQSRIGDAWTDPQNPIVRIFGGQRLDLWSVKPLKRVQPPPIAHNGTFTKNPIDAYVLAALRERGMGPAAQADRRTLARRVSFDLTGLPPTAEMVAQFVEDDRADAYERYVDKLLESPRYGEHWARQWMDVIRYSDSNGFDWDEFRPRAWRFRDYLIRSFNSDKPFDQLIREHLAGDELVAGEPKNEAERDALIATGFLRVGPQDNSASLFNEQPRARAEYMADVTETTASAFLGVTMSCARCHDHKYDPISHADHYRLRAFFEPLKYGDDIPLDLAGEQKEIREHNKQLDQKIAPFKQQKDELIAAVKTRLRNEKASKLSDDEKRLIELPKDQRPAEKKDQIDALLKKIEIKDKEATAALNEEEKKRHEELGKEIAALEKQRRSFTLGLLATDNTEKIPVTKILFQGDHKAEREAVQPGFLSILDPNPASIEKGLNPKTTGRRLALANWIASTNNPLTARVFVNRMWQSLLGEGLVDTPNDFGLAGGKPSHPELLDWLAAEFMRRGWSVKQLHRLIVTSGTYRQESTGIFDAAKHDGENTLHWRHSMRRISAEQLRDSLLAVSGLLKIEHPGGPPIWPDLPADILQANPAFLDDNAEKTKGWYPSPKTNQHVRSIYVIQKRTVRVPFLETFDMPENSVSCARRNESIVAPQALSLLNGSIAIEAARALAGRVKAEAGDDPARQVEATFAAVLQRRPDAGEHQQCVQLLRSQSLVELCRALLNVNEFLFVD